MPVLFVVAFPYSVFFCKLFFTFLFPLSSFLFPLSSFHLKSQPQGRFPGVGFLFTFLFLLERVLLNPQDSLLLHFVCLRLSVLLKSLSFCSGLLPRRSNRLQ